MRFNFTFVVQFVEVRLLHRSWVLSIPVNFGNGWRIVRLGQVTDVRRLMSINRLTAKLVCNDLTTFEAYNSRGVVESLPDIVTCLVDLPRLHYRGVFFGVWLIKLLYCGILVIIEVFPDLAGGAGHHGGVDASRLVH